MSDSKFEVIRSFDGVPQPNKVFKQGTYNECRTWILSMSFSDYSHLCNDRMELEILNLDTGRLMSYA